jgi:hypothetical protein
MKVLFTLLLLFLLTSDCLSQTPATSPAPQDVAIIQKQWRAEVRNPLMDESPFEFLDRISQEEAERIRQANAARRQTQRARNSTQQLPPDTGRMETPPESNPAENRQPLKLNEARVIYIYKIKVRNDGEKAIKALVWEYVFSEPETGREVGRRRFLSKTKIDPGKTKELTMRSASPPTGSINAASIGKKSQNQYSEKIVIRAVQFTDGSVKQNAADSTDKLSLNSKKPESN